MWAWVWVFTLANRCVVGTVDRRSRIRTLHRFGKIGGENGHVMMCVCVCGDEVQGRRVEAEVEEE